MAFVTWQRAVLAVVVIFAGAQLIRPAKTNPAINPAYEVQRVEDPGPAVSDIINRSCADCHSNRTVWPWYSSVAPVSWLVVHDVNEGRGELNFSEWGTYTARRRDRKLTEICNEVREGDMPGAAYALMHPQAKLSPADVNTLCEWTQRARQAGGSSAQTGATQR